MRDDRSNRKVPIGQIVALGFDWPSEKIPAEYVVQPSESFVDLDATMDSLERAAEKSMETQRRGRAFARSHREEMSAYEYSGWNDGYDSYIFDAADLRKAVEYLQKIAGKLRQMEKTELPEFYSALEEHLAGRFDLVVVDQVVTIARSNNLAEKTPEERRSLFDTCADSWGFQGMYDPPGSQSHRMSRAYDAAIVWSRRRGPG